MPLVATFNKKDQTIFKNTFNKTFNFKIAYKIVTIKTCQTWALKKR